MRTTRFLPTLRSSGLVLFTVYTFKFDSTYRKSSREGPSDMFDGDAILLYHDTSDSWRPGSCNLTRSSCRGTFHKRFLDSVIVDEIEGSCSVNEVSKLALHYSNGEHLCLGDRLLIPIPSPFLTIHSGIWMPKTITVSDLGENSTAPAAALPSL